MEILYGIMADFLTNLMFLYVPFVYLMKPRKGSRYVNLVILVAIYNGWTVSQRYFFLPSNIVFYVFLSWGLIYFISCIFYTSQNGRRVKVWATMFVLGMFSELITSLILTTVLPELWKRYIYVQFEESFLNIARLVGALVMEVMGTVWALIILCLVRKRRWGIFLGFMLIPVYQACLTVGFFRMCTDFTESVAMTGYGIIFFNVILDGVILYLLEGIFKKLDREEELQALEEQRRQEYVYYEADSQYVNEMRLMRHDFANQLQTAYSMMDEPESVERVKALLEEMREKIGGENETLVRDRCGFS